MDAADGARFGYNMDRTVLADSEPNDNRNGDRGGGVFPRSDEHLAQLVHGVHLPLGQGALLRPEEVLKQLPGPEEPPRRQGPRRWRRSRTGWK